jgi:predicted dehydrogenase
MKVAVIGIGSVGRRHIENLLRLGMVNVVAVSENNKIPNLELSGRNVPVVHSYKEALQSKCDAVVIANPSVFHLEYARRAVLAGCHVYLEKPAATSGDGLPELIALARELRRVVAIGTQNRFNARLEDLRNRIQSGEAGMIVGVYASLGEHIADYHPNEDYRRSYTAQSALGGGVLLTQIHQLDYLNWLFGPFSRVFAVGGKRSDLEIDVEDSVSYLLSGKDDVPVAGHLNYLQRPKKVSLEVIGTRTSYQWGYFDHCLTVTPAKLASDAMVIRDPFDRNEMFMACMKDFLEAIAGGRRPRADLSDALAALRIVDAIKVSCRDNCAVEIVQ